VEPQQPQTAPANATATFYYWDHLGTTRMAAPEVPTAANVERHDYEPYGLEMLPATNQAGNTHQFTGHGRDLDTGIDYMHFRFYGSNIGRFMKPDSGVAQDPQNPQSWNLYSYVKGNPVNLNDPTGHEDEGVLAESLGREQEAVIQGTMTEKQFIDTQAARAAGAAAGLVVDLTIVNPSAGIEAAKGLYSLLKGDLGGAVGHALNALDAAFNGQSGKEDTSATSSKGLEQQVAAHKQKLEQYKKDPMSMDNKNTLRNAPSEKVKQQIIEGRIKKLEKEIRNFEKQIKSKQLKDPQ
jgi:RHS repeat-associated protein